MEFAGIAEEIDYFVELFLGLLDAGDIFEGHLVAVHGEEAGFAFAERHGTATGGFHLLAEEEEEDADDEKEGQEGEEDAFEVIGGAIVARIGGEQLFQIIAEDGNGNGDAEGRGFEFFTGWILGHHHVRDDLAAANDDGFVRAGRGKEAEGGDEILGLDFPERVRLAELGEREGFDFGFSGFFNRSGQRLEVQVIAQDFADFAGLEGEIDGDAEFGRSFLGVFGKCKGWSCPASDGGIVGGVRGDDFKGSFRIIENDTALFPCLAELRVLKTFCRFIYICAQECEAQEDHRNAEEDE